MRKMIVEAQRDLETLIRDLCGLLPSVALRRFARSGDQGPCRPRGRVFGGVKWQRPSAFVFAFVLIAAFSVEVRADQQPIGGDAVVLAPDVTKWSSELKGGQWGWHLTKYGSLDWFFQIGGKTLIMLSTDMNTTDNVLWDPLTGAGLHLNHEEYERFTEGHKDDHYTIGPDLYTDRLFPLEGGRMIQTKISSPYIANTCGMLFAYYLNIYGEGHIYGEDQDLIRSFYVIAKLRHPITVMRDTCAEGDNGPNPYPADFRYNAEIS